MAEKINETQLKKDIQKMLEQEEKRKQEEAQFDKFFGFENVNDKEPKLIRAKGVPLTEQDIIQESFLIYEYRQQQGKNLTISECVEQSLLNNGNETWLDACRLYDGISKQDYVNYIANEVKKLL